jgi:hypothetical protein
MTRVCLYLLYFTPFFFAIAPLLCKAQESGNSPCETILHQVRYDLANYANQTSDQNLPWMNINWLKSQLGHAKLANVYDYVYVWKNFSMFMGADGFIAKIGTLPNQVEAKTFYEVVTFMGPPKQTLFEKLNLYNWICPNNNHSYLAILTKENGESISILGRDCNNYNQCELFTKTYAESDIKLKFNQQMKKEAEFLNTLLIVRLKNYNDHFKTSLQNQTQLNEDITAKIKDYYFNLRRCNVGVYQYAVPVLQDYLYQTAIISKRDFDRCIVQTTYKIPLIGKVDLKCQYPVKDLSLFSDSEAESLARGNSNFNIENPSELQKLMKSECKRYIGGVL